MTRLLIKSVSAHRHDWFNLVNKCKYTIHTVLLGHRQVRWFSYYIFHPTLNNSWDPCNYVNTIFVFSATPTSYWFKMSQVFSSDCVVIFATYQKSEFAQGWVRLASNGTSIELTESKCSEKNDDLIIQDNIWLFMLKFSYLFGQRFNYTSIRVPPCPK